LENLFLFPKLALELCEMQCKGEDMVIQTSVSLKTKHISFGCDRDTSKCAKNELIDLLPKNTEWTKDLVYDEGSESVFHFDGSSGAVVPQTIVKPDDFSSHPFSIVTMFRHHSIASNDKHSKEHIICSADDHSRFFPIKKWH
jgi:calsyntenin 1